MNTTITTEPSYNAAGSALKRCVCSVWQVSRRMGILCWAIGVAIINLGEH